MIEIVDQTKDLKKLSQGDLVAFNQYLESFYNARGEETLNYVPHYFFFNDIKNKKLPKHIRNSLIELKQANSYEEKNFDPKIIDHITGLLKRMKDMPTENKITLHSHLIMDLYLDSLDMAEIKNSILNEYPQASNTPILELKTVADLIAMAMGLTNSEKLNFKPCEWRIKNSYLDWHLDENQNILENFKYQWKQEK